MEKLTSHEARILKAIIRLSREHGYPPTLEEIGKAVGTGTRAGVLHHVRALEKKGYIGRGNGRRSLKVFRGGDGIPVPQLTEMVAIPRYDRVRGGPLDLARTDVEDFISVPKKWLGGERGFTIRVVGDSMAPNLMEGDLVIVRRQAVAENGDIVVALVGDEATIKRFRRADDHVILAPDNPNHRALNFRAGAELRILGKVVRSIRRFA